MTNVSIIIPVFNKSAHILRTLNSVVSQSYSRWQAIIIDDGSTDNSLSLINTFVNQLEKIDRDKFIVISQSNIGQSASRFRAMTVSTGSFIAFLDGDDFWAPNKLIKQVSFLENNPNLDLVLTNYLIFRRSNRKDVAVDLKPVERKIVNWANTDGFGGLVESTGLFRRTFLNAYLSVDLPAMSGGLLLCIYAMKQKKIGLVDEYLCGYLETNQGWHNNKGDLINSYNKLFADNNIPESLRQSMRSGLKHHLDLWEIRTSKPALNFHYLATISKLFNFSTIYYSLKIAYRLMTARLKYVIHYNKFEILRKSL